MAIELVKTGDLSSLALGEVATFLDSQDTGHPFQFPQWAPDSACALLRESGAIKWFGMFGTYFPLGPKLPWVRAMVANRGPVCDDPKLWHAAMEEFAQRMKQERLAYFDVSPDWLQASSTLLGDVLDRTVWKQAGPERVSLRLDLTKSEDEILAGFRKGTRYEVRRAERAGVSVVAATTDAEIDEFLALYARLAVRKAFVPESVDHMRRQIRWLLSESRGAVLLARLEGAALGGAVIGRSRRRCWYLWGASDRQNLDVGHVVQWNALSWAKAQGCTEYDFGGYTPGATSGPAWFKAGFGGTEVRFVAPRRRVVDETRYRMFSAAARLKWW